MRTHLHSTICHCGECQRRVRSNSANRRSVGRPLRFLALLAVIAALAPALRAQDLAAADAAFMQQQFPDAQRGYRAALAKGALADRKKAALALAVIDWMIDGDTARAMRDLRPFAQTSPALAMMSRARLNAHNVAGARSAARAAITAAHDDEERRAAAVALGAAAAFPYEWSCLDSTAPARTRTRARNDSTVREAITRLRATVIAEAGHLDPSERLVRLSALAGDWPSLAIGWKSYYVVGARTPNGPLVRAEGELRAMESAAPAEKAAHAYAALVDSKMFEPAALIATCGALASRAPDSATAEVIAYAHFLREAKRVTNAYYRTVALGHANVDGWRAALDSAGRRLWPRLVWSGAPPAFTQDSLIAQLDRRFALVVNAGTTGNVEDLHSGHRVSDETREVHQYGKSAHIHFSVLDGMISDGYQSWAWDGRAAHGGWASDTEIMQVRDAYADGPLRAWHARTDPAIIARKAQALASDSAADIARAREKEVAYFPSVDARLRRDAELALIDSLKRTGLGGRDLELAFVRVYGNDIDEGSIFAHEGRHAIDKTLHIRDSSATNLEYQAKLSQIAFGPLPKIGLAGVLEPTTGDNTPHGTADARLIGELLDWMRHHGFSESGGSLPLPLQMPALTDAQLREAARSLDPLARDSAQASH